MKTKKNKNFLIIAAHPDDEILGCGATAAKLINNGYKGSLIIVSEGITSRDDQRNLSKRNKELKKLRQICKKANNYLGISNINFLGLPDNRLDQIPLLQIIKLIEKIIDKNKPEIIFTHNSSDLNKDHQIVYEAAVTACRPLPKSSVKKILSFEVLSSTNWAAASDNKFEPNYFVEVDKFIKKKLKALNFYKSEMRKYPHARSLRAVKALSEYRGSSVGLNYAESFKLIISKKDLV